MSSRKAAIPVLEINPLGEIERKGAIYCGAGCGCECRHDAFERAVREAKRMASRLSGWQPVVHENCGWHVTLYRGKAQISPLTDGSHLAGNYSITGYLGIFNGIRSFTVEGADLETVRDELLSGVQHLIVQAQSELKVLEAA